MTVVTAKRSVRSWLGPGFLLVGLLGLHWAMSVPKVAMITDDDRMEDDGDIEGGKEAKAFAKEYADKGFVAMHEPVLEHAFRLASEFQASWFPGDPPVALESIECRQWRCQLQVCGGRRAVRGVMRALRTMEMEDVDLWEAFETHEPDESPAGEGSELCLVGTGRYSRPAPEAKGIRIAKRLKTKRQDALDKRAENERRKAAKKSAPKGTSAPAPVGIVPLQKNADKPSAPQPDAPVADSN